MALEDNQLQSNLNISPEDLLINQILGGMSEVPEQDASLPSIGLIPDTDQRNYERFFGPGYDPTANLENQAAMYQGNFERWGKMLPRVGVKIASEVAQMPGYAVGLGDWASTGFKTEEIGRMVDNAWLQTVQNAEQFIQDKAFAIYVPDSVKNGNLLQNVMSPAFWATEGADGIGFLAAMLVPGMAFRQAGLAGKAVKGLETYEKALKTGSKMSRLMKPAKAVAGGIDDWGAALLNTVYEAGAEAGEGYREVMAATGGNKQLAGEAAAGIMKANFIILLPSNVLTQKWLFSAFGKQAAKSAGAEAFGEVLDEFGKVVSKASTSKALSKALTSSISHIKPTKKLTAFAQMLPAGIASEGFWEEGTQFSASEYFKNKALGETEDGPIRGMINTYVDSLSNIDMQKSIFLGSFLGGIMGGVGGVSEAKQRDRFLFGTPEIKKEDLTLFDKIINNQPRKGSPGYINLVSNNLLDRYSLSELIEYTVDEDGNRVAKLNKDGSLYFSTDTKIKMLQQAVNMAHNVDSKEAMAEALARGNQPLFELLKRHSDFQIMYPFFEMEGGEELLDRYIDNLAEGDAKFFKDAYGIDNLTTKKTKAQLKATAKSLKASYDTVQAKHNKSLTVKPKLEDFTTYQEWAHKLFQKKLTNDINQKFFSEQIRELRRRVRRLETIENNESEDLTTLEKEELTEKKDLLIVLEQELAKLKIRSKTLYSKRASKKSYDEFLQSKIDNAATLESKDSADTEKKIKDATSKEEVDNIVKEVDDKKPVVEPERKLPVQEADDNTVPSEKVGEKEEPAPKKESMFSKNIHEAADEKKRDLEKDEAVKNKREGKEQSKSEKDITDAAERIKDDEPPIQNKKDEENLRDKERATAEDVGPTFQKSKTKGAKTSSVSVAYKGKASKIVDDRHEDVYDEDGKLVVTENMDERINLPTEWKSGTKIVLFIDKDYEGSEALQNKDSYENNKDNPDEIPIGVQLLDEFGKPQVTFYLHKLSWILEGNMNPHFQEQVHEETKALRAKIFKAGEPLVTTITDKSSGWINRQENFVTLEEAFGKDNNVFFALGNRSNSLLKHDSSTENILNEGEAQERGRPYVLIPTSNGKYVASWLSTMELSQNPEMYKLFTQSIADILTDFSKTEGKEIFTDETTFDEMLAEVHKFFFATNHFRMEEKSDSMDVRTVFNLRQSNISGRLLMELPYIEETDEASDAAPTIRYARYEWKNGELYQLYSKDGKLFEVLVAEPQALFEAVFQFKYANIVKEPFLAINRADEGTFYTIQRVDGKLQKVEERYFNFLSKVGMTQTRIEGKEVEGIQTYTSQPTVTLDSNPDNLHPLDTKEEIEVPPEIQQERFDSFVQAHEEAFESAKLERDESLIPYQEALDAAEKGSTSAKVAQRMIDDINATYEARVAEIQGKPAPIKEEPAVQGTLEFNKEKKEYQESKNSTDEQTLQKAPTSEEAKKTVAISKGADVIVTKGRHKGKSGIIEGYTQSGLAIVSFGEDTKQIAIKNLKIPEEVKPEEPIVEEFSSLFDMGETKIDPIAKEKEREASQEEDDDLAQFSEVNHNNATLSSLIHMENGIDEDEMITSLVAAVFLRVDFVEKENREKGKRVQSAKLYSDAIGFVFDELLQNRNFYRQYSTTKPNDKVIAKGIFPTKAENAAMASIYDDIINYFNESKIEGTDTIAFVGYRERILHEIDSVKFHVLSDDNMIEEDEHIQERTHHRDDYNMTTDPEKSLAGRIRRMLYFIPKRDENGKVESNILGMAKYEDYMQIYNGLTFILSDLEVDEMLPELEKLAAQKQLYRSVLNELKKTTQANPELLPQFLTAFRKQSIHLKVLLYRDNGKNSPPTWELIDSNRSSASQMISNGWHSDFKEQGAQTGLLYKDKTTFRISNEKGVALNQRFRAIVAKYNRNKNAEQAFTAIQELLTEIGIVVSDEAFEKIMYDLEEGNNILSRRFGGKYTDTKNFLNRAISPIFTALTGKATEEHVDAPFKEGNPFYTQSKLIKALASYELAYQPDIFSASFRNAEGKLYYSFVNPHFLSDRMMKLGNEEATKLLSQVAFLKQSSWLQMLNDKNESFIDTFSLFYFDATKNRKKSAQVDKFELQNSSDRANTRLAMFQNQGNKSAFYFTNTPSDKTTFTLIQAPKHKLDFGQDVAVFMNGLIYEDRVNLDSGTVDELFKIVMAEITRINAVVTEYNDNIDSHKERLHEGYHYIVNKDGETVLGGGAYLFSFPQLNGIIKRNKDQSIVLTDGDILELKEAMMTEVFDLVKHTIVTWHDTGTIDFHTGTTMFDRAYFNKISKISGEKYKKQSKINYAATDYVVNTLIAQMNMFQLISGDPAMFTKVKDWDNSWEQLINESSVNLFKRIAKDIAPGEKGAFESKTVNYIFLNEPQVDSALAEHAKGKLSILAKKYIRLKAADAQEWTTAEEHIRVLYAFGRLRKAELDAFLAKIELQKESKTDDPTHDFNMHEMSRILQPQKPVYVNSEISEDIDAEVPFYIKTSSFPLLAQLTRGSEQLTTFRLMLENNNIDRAVVQSGVKTGYNNPLEIFSTEGKINTITKSLKPYIKTLSRDGFKNQQDVPYKESKVQILEGSQLRKLRYADLMIDWDFNLDGNTLKGYALRDLDDQVHNLFYRRRLSSLVQKLAAEEIDGKLRITDVNKLRKVLIEEAKARGYSYNDILMLSSISLKNDEGVIFEVPLFHHPAGESIEALLNSLFTDGVLKNRLSGHSYVQGSPVGFEFEDTSIQDEDFLKAVDGTKGRGIVFTKEHDGGPLGYKLNEKGELISADVLIPFFPRTVAESPTKNKKHLDLNDYIKDGYLDMEKIDPRMLELIGYRIPTQGHNSMVKLRVVGFLPQEMGDLVIVPPEMTKQMGSDFDVDKLYTHFFNYTHDPITGYIGKVDSNVEIKDGKIKNIEKHSNKQLENALLDINFAILNNKNVVEMSMNPIDNPTLAEEKETITKYRALGEEAQSKRQTELKGDVNLTAPQLAKLSKGQRLIISSSEEEHTKNYKGDGNYMSGDSKISMQYVMSGNVTDFKLVELDSISIREGFKDFEDLTNNGSPIDKAWANGKLKKHFYEVKMDIVPEGPGLPQTNVDSRTAASSSILYTEHQTHMVDVNADGKTGIAMNSVFSTSHALAQHAGIHLRNIYTIQIIKGEEVKTLVKDGVAAVMFKDKNGKVYTDVEDDNNRVISAEAANYSEDVPEEGAWRLDKVTLFDSDRTILSVLTNIQTASVDNANLQELFGLHLSEKTFPVASLIARAGFNEHFIAAFINQPIIREYIKELKNLRKITDGRYDPRAEENLVARMYSKFSQTTFEPGKVTAFSLEEMYEMIKDGGREGDKQVQILYNFLQYEKVTRELSAIHNVSNVDTKYLGKNIYDSVSKARKFVELPDRIKFTVNHGNLFIDTMQLGALTYGLIPSLQMFSSDNLFPVTSAMFEHMLDSYAIFTGDIKGSKELQGGDVSHIAANLRGALFLQTLVDMYLPGVDLKDYRKKMMFDTATNKSLATEIKELQKGSKNFFLKVLQVDKAYEEGQPAVITYEASKETKKEISTEMALGWNKLLNSHKNSKEYKVGVKLLLYVALNGNDRDANSFAAFIPKDFYVTSGLGRGLRDINFNKRFDSDEVVDTDTIEGKVYTRFIKQYFQHFPQKAKQFNPNQVHKAIDKDKNRVTSFKVAPDIIYFKNTKTDPTVADTLNVKLPSGKLKVTDFISYYNSSTQKTHLYQLQGKQQGHSVFKEVPTLRDETNMLSEYDLTKEQTESIYTNDKASKTKPDLTRVEPAVLHPGMQFGGNINMDLKDSIFNKYGFKEGMIATLEGLAERATDPVIANLAKMILEKHPAVLDKYTLAEYDPNDKTHWKGGSTTVERQTPIGRTQYLKKRILLNKKLISTDVGFQEVFLHEVLHVLTSEAFRAENLTGDALAARDAIVKMHGDLKNNPEFMAKLVELYGEHEAGRIMDKASELSAYIFANKEMRDLMNDTQYDSKTTFLQKFLQYLTQLFGFDVKKGSALEASMFNILALTDYSETLTEEDLAISPTPQGSIPLRVDKFIPNNLEESNDMLIFAEMNSLSQLLRELPPSNRRIILQSIRNKEMKVICK